MSAEDVHTGCDWMHLLHAAQDAGMTVTALVQPDGVSEVRLIPADSCFGTPFVGDVQSAVEAASVWLCRQGAAA